MTKEMEAKTENRYEYRKPQEKRKQMIAPDLFEFAYVPDWYGHLAELERLALPESWKFRKPSRETKNADTPILERYIHTIFRKQVIDFNSESDQRKADSIFHLENECVCFHTGLYTSQYKGIYGYFERNNFSNSLRDWYFRGFCDELSPKLRYIEPLPQKPVYHIDVVVTMRAATIARNWGQFMEFMLICSKKNVDVVCIDKVEDAQAIFRRIQEFQKRFFEGSDVTCE